MPKRLITSLLLAAALPSGSAWSQCVMCYRTAEAQNAARAHILNIGIVLLGMPPFLILAGFLYLAWRRNLTFAGIEEHDEHPETQPLSLS
jgi:hypothetical protein